MSNSQRYYGPDTIRGLTEERRAELIERCKKGVESHEELAAAFGMRNAQMVRRMARGTAGKAAKVTLHQTPERHPICATAGRYAELHAYAVAHGITDCAALALWHRERGR
mgnify:CR=1 FL=1